LDSEQSNFGVSLVLQPELYQAWGSHSLLFVPFYRLDQHDKERIHFDIRELYWLYYSDNWEFRAGIRKVFWGVTESQHLVDVINQTDFVENIDGEDKLGQPMIQFTLIRDWGSLDLFMLIGFRERFFPGRDGRLRFPLLINREKTQYEAKNEDQHIDWAVRWSHILGDFDVGASYFIGTSREPRYIFDDSDQNNPDIFMFYDQMQQFGIDAQYTAGGWLWKLESIVRESRARNKQLFALTGGFEYTFSNLMDTGVDLGTILEYLYDDRDQSVFPPNPFDNHIFVGARFAFNDVQSTEILAGSIINVDNNGFFMNMEASRRIGERIKANLEIRGFGKIEETDFFYAFRKDTYVQLELEWYF